ncbi:olfactory receptor 52K2-like [Rana temporaria]|uniref:olfactory receptor 52K2-like n=1 Tax=Rana temporaria TaxID=8407 RepID=UPI001AAC99D1|nr:olfactory receptor 52K2-like [Rana temporaria]
MLNMTFSRPTHFILLGIPGLETSYVSLGFIFFLMYAISLIGNLTLLFIIRLDRNLHEPMYLFLSMLSSIDLVVTSTTTPKVLAILWFDSKEIYYEACLTQMFFTNSFTCIESSILLAMAFDRYAAICHPLRYTSILTNRVILAMSLCCLCRGVAYAMPLSTLYRRLSLCGNNVIYHSFCDHYSTVKLACSDSTLNTTYGLVGSLAIVGVDLSLIALSYVFILHAVFHLKSTEARLKALSTCTSHISVFLVFCLTIVLSAVVQRFAKSVPLYVIILLANVYLMLPAFVNPLIYGIRTKPIRHRIVTLLLCYK